MSSLPKESLVLPFVDVIVCSLGQSDMLKEKLKLMNELWSANIRSTVLCFEEVRINHSITHLLVQPHSVKMNFLNLELGSNAELLRENENTSHHFHQGIRARSGRIEKLVERSVIDIYFCVLTFICYRIEHNILFIPGIMKRNSALQKLFLICVEFYDRTAWILVSKLIILVIIIVEPSQEVLLLVLVTTDPSV